MQKHLKEQMETNQAYEKARTEMVSGISHDLRTPLTSVKGYLKGMLDGIANTEEKRKEYLLVAYRKSCDMEKLLAKLFYFSKLETGNMPFYFQKVDMGAYLEDYQIQIGNLTILTKSWKGMKNGKEIHFPNREFELLKYMALNPNIVFSKEHLFEKIWGYDYMSDNATVTVHINRIREKIEDDPKNPQIIETVWGAGYRLNLR